MRQFKTLNKPSVSNRVCSTNRYKRKFSSSSLYTLFALGIAAEFTVSKLAARRVAKIHTFSDCQIDVLHVIIWEKCLNLCKIVIKIMDEKVKKKSRRSVLCGWLWK